jgi:hypothetical protein
MSPLLWIMSLLLCADWTVGFERLSDATRLRSVWTRDYLLKRLHGTLAEQLLGAFDEASVGGYG